MRNRPAERVVDVLGEASLLDLVVEDEAAKRRFPRPASFLGFSHRPVANRADRFTEHRRPHHRPLRLSRSDQDIQPLNRAS